MAGFGKREKREKIELSKDSYKKAKRIFAFMRPYRFIYTIGWLFLIGSSLISMLFPVLMGQLLGAQDGEAAVVEFGGVDMTNINVILTVMLLVFATQAFFSFFRIVIFNKVTESTLRDIKKMSFSKLVNLPVDFYNRNKVGELSSRIATDITLIQETLNTTIAEFFRQFITIAVALSFILYLSWELALWMLAVVPVLAIIAITFGRYIKKLSKLAQEESAKSNSILVEVLTGIVNVKAFTNEKYEANRYENTVTKIMGINVKRGVMRGLFVSFIIFGMKAF